MSNMTSVVFGSFVSLAMCSAAFADGAAAVSPPENSATINIPADDRRNLYVIDHEPGADVIVTLRICNESTTSAHINVISNSDSSVGMLLLFPGDCGVASGIKIEAVNQHTSAAAIVEFNVMAISLDSAPG